MVLIAIVGKLGVGKTLALTFLAQRNYYEGMNIYSNYALKFPYTYVEDVEDLDNMKSGFFAGDELWLWLDSRSSHSSRNKFISAMLIKSRKRNLQIAYTAQSFFQIDVRVRNITDYIVIPSLNSSKTICTLRWYTRESIMMGKTIKIMRFNTKDVFDLYDTTEEINDLEPSKDDADN